MSARVDFAFLRAVRSPGGPSTSDARHVALVLGLRADRGSCFLDRASIAAETLLGRRRVRFACAVLIAEGWATEEHLPGQPKWVLQVPEGGRNRSGCEVKTGQAEPVPTLETGQAEIPKPVRLDVETGQATPPGSTPKKTPTDKPHQKDPKRDLQTPTPALNTRTVAREEPVPVSPQGQLGIPGIASPPSKPIDPLHAPEVTEVLEHWRSRGYHTRKPIDDPKGERRKRIRDRLDEGLDVATLKAAIDGASLDDFLMARAPGRNDLADGGKLYTGIQTILRDAAQVEKLATIWDVALAEGRVHEDGGTTTHDRFGNRRPPPPKPPGLTDEQRAEVRRMREAYEATLRSEAEAKAAKIAEEQRQARERFDEFTKDMPSDQREALRRKMPNLGAQA